MATADCGLTHNANGVHNAQGFLEIPDTAEAWTVVPNFVSMTQI